jgi:hypothetical protein
MGVLESLLLAIGNAAVPGLGFFASIVSAISSEEKNAGGRFLFDLASNFLPSGFWTDLAAGIMGDAIFESDVYSAAKMLVPTNNIVSPCDGCGNFTKKYILRNGRILCANCLSSDIDGHMRKDYKIYIYKQKVSNLHGRFLVANNLATRQIASKNLKGRSI